MAVLGEMLLEHISPRPACSCERVTIGVMMLLKIAMTWTALGWGKNKQRNVVREDWLCYERVRNGSLTNMGLVMASRSGESFEA